MAAVCLHVSVLKGVLLAVVERKGKERECAGRELLAGKRLKV